MHQCISFNYHADKYSVKWQHSKYVQQMEFMASSVLIHCCFLKINKQMLLEDCDNTLVNIQQAEQSIRNCFHLVS